MGRQVLTGAVVLVIGAADALVGLRLRMSRL